MQIKKTNLFKYPYSIDFMKTDSFLNIFLFKSNTMLLTFEVDKFFAIKSIA